MLPVSFYVWGTLAVPLEILEEKPPLPEACSSLLYSSFALADREVGIGLGSKGLV